MALKQKFIWCSNLLDYNKVYFFGVLTCLIATKFFPLNRPGSPDGRVPRGYRRGSVTPAGTEGMATEVFY